MLKNICAVWLLAMIWCTCATAAPEETVQSRPPRPLSAAVLPEGKVTLDGKPVLIVKARLMAYSPVQRANSISERLTALTNDPWFRISQITVTESEGGSSIVARDMVIMAVTDSDAAAEGKPRQAVAEMYAQSIRNALSSHNEDYTMGSLLSGALNAGGVTLALIVILYLLKRLFPWAIARIESWQKAQGDESVFKSKNSLHQQRVLWYATRSLRWLRILIVLLLFYIYIPLVCSFFPWTREVASVLREYTLNPLGVVWSATLNYLPNVFFIIVIIILTRVVIRLTRILFKEIELGNIELSGFHVEWAEPSFKLARFLIIAFSVVVAFPYLPGSQSPAFKGVSVFLGLLLSLGSSSAISNIVSGVILIYTRAFRVGDRVKIADTVGDVIEKTLLVTRIRTIKNVDITIPNAMVLGSHIINYNAVSQEQGLILNTTVTIGYDAPWRTVHELLQKAACVTGDILQTPPPFVLQTALNDFYVSYELNAYTDKPQRMATIYSELHKNIQDTFNEAGVEIMSPHYSQLRDGNMTTTPESYLPKDYTPSAFRVGKVPPSQ